MCLTKPMEQDTTHSIEILQDELERLKYNIAQLQKQLIVKTSEITNLQIMQGFYEMIDAHEHWG